MADARDHARRASDLFDAGKFPEAIEAYTQAINADSSNSGYYNDRGAAKHRLSDFNGALADYAQAVRLKPTYSQARMNAAYALQRLNRAAEAIDGFEAAIKCDPMKEVDAYAAIAELSPSIGRTAPIPRIADIKTCINEAREAERTGNHKDALAAYDRAIGMDARLASLHLQRGTTNKTLKNYLSSLADFDQAIAIKPDWAQAYLERGMAKSASGDLQGAADDAAASARCDPTYVWAYNNRASALHRLGRFDEAFIEANKAIQIDPTVGLAYVNRAMARIGLKQEHEALADYRRACSVEPALTRDYRGNMVDLQMGLALRSKGGDLGDVRQLYDAGVAHYDKNEFQPAVDAFEAAIARINDVPAFYLQRGLARLALKRFDDAAADYRRAAELWPSFAMAWSNLAYTTLEQKRYDEALAAAERGLAIDPDSAYLNTYAGRALAGQKDYAGAIVRFDRAILHYPDVPAVYWSRALSRWETQNWQGVIDDMNMAVKKDPSFTEDAKKWIPVAEQKLGRAPAPPAPAKPEPIANLPPWEVKNHGGVRHARDLDFFAGPPREIGPLISAHSSLAKGVEPTPTGKRLVYLIIWSAIFLGVGVAIDHFAALKDGFWYWAWPVGLPLIAAFISWSSTSFDHTCTYIGKLGVARYNCSKRRNNISDQKTLLFEWVTELRTSGVRRYRNGVYQGTDYTHSWSDAKGAVHFVIRGSHNSENGLPGATDAYMFAHASEIAWSEYLLDRADEELNRVGYLHFSNSGRDYVRVASNWIEFSFGGKQERRASSDIAAITLNAGQFTLRTADASDGWFFKKGIFTFPYGQMANAKLFLLALEKLARIRVT